MSFKFHFQDIGAGWWEASNSRGQNGLVPESYLEVSSFRDWLTLTNVLGCD